MRYLGIDYGRIRTGVALSDPDGRIAFAREVIAGKETGGALRRIQALVRGEHVGRVIVGMPMGLNGKDTLQTAAVRKFVELLKKNISVPVATEDEMFTTRMSNHAGVKKSLRDGASAAIMLQSYLDKKT